jgi:ADP-ribose pyrophosphatase YjhB (NUDIX family)
MWMDNMRKSPRAAYRTKASTILGIKHCASCGSELTSSARPATRAFCTGCGRITHLSATIGPSLLVLIEVFAADRVLLIKRGIAPYIGKWAPPGGFVEAGESLETAAIRELHEEAQMALEPTQLIPQAVISVPEMNQVYHVFVAKLNRTLPVRPQPPECTDAKWFSELEVSTLDVWDPLANIDVKTIFSKVRANRFQFFQQSDHFSRFITNGHEMTYLWRRS